MEFGDAADTNMLCKFICCTENVALKQVETLTHAQFGAELSTVSYCILL